jgi:uncharacterized caspase-like protein
VRTKIITVLLLLAVLNLSIVFAASASQPYEQSKGGFNVQSTEVLKGKPSSPKPPHGDIATGIVSAPTGKRYAIVIGISDYAGSTNDLQYCDDDAREFNDALLANGWKNSQITLLIDGDATRTKILDAINLVSRVAETEDEVVFFYSGHGTISYSDVDGDGEKRDECIIPVELSTGTFIWDGELKTAFAECQSQRMMFYFDSCYSGGMTDLAGPGRLILMACGENQLSLESSAWQNGQFTYYFVDQGMSAGSADANGDSQVTFEEAFDFAKANCQRQSPVASDGFAFDMLP